MTKQSKEKPKKKEKVSAKKPSVKAAKKTPRKDAKTTEETKIEKVEKSAHSAPGARAEKENAELKVELKPERYWEAVGRRKTAVARVRLFTRGDKGIWVNGKSCDIYFHTEEMRRTAEDALKKMKAQERFRVTVKASGGGLRAQSEAVRHGTARALTKFNPDFRKRLKRAGFLTRDPRMVERKKFGLKKARRAPQWAKR